jgi:transcriptional regulator with XRE-family HTH domain
MANVDVDSIDWAGLPSRIRVALKQHDLSHREFAEAANVSLPAVTKWLNGGRISHDNWRPVADALHLNVDELLGTKRRRTPPQPRSSPDDVRAALLLERLAALSTEPFDRAVPDLMQVLKEAQELAEAARS